MKNSKEIAKTVLKIRDDYLECQRKRNRKIKMIASFGSAVCIFAVVIICVNRYSYSNSNLKSPSVTDLTITSTTGNNPQKASHQAYENLEESNLAETNLPADTTNGFTTDKSGDAPQINISEESSFNDSQDKSGNTSETGISEENSFDDSHADNENKQTTQILSPANSVDATSPTDSESFPEPKWDEKTISAQFSEFNLNNTIYSTSNTMINSAIIGTKIDNIIMVCEDVYTDITHSINAEVFSISNVSDNCATAIKFEGYDDYYVYISMNYHPDTLGELADALNLNSNISFGDLVTGDDMTIVTDYNITIIKNLLTEYRDCENLSDDTFHRNLFSIITNIDMLGIKNKSFSVTDDGYIITNIMDWKYTFYIGTDKAKELADRLGINYIDMTETTNYFLSQEEASYEE